MKKAASILLAIFFLLSSSHLSFATHFCGGHSFFHELVFDASHVGCDMDDESNPKEMDECDDDHNCCDTHIVELSLKDNFQATDLKVSFQPEFIFVKIAAILFTVPTSENIVALYKDYKPLIPDKDISVLFQSFLI